MFSPKPWRIIPAPSLNPNHLHGAVPRPGHCLKANHLPQQLLKGHWDKPHERLNSPEHTILTIPALLYSAASSEGGTREAAKGMLRPSKGWKLIVPPLFSAEQSLLAHGLICVGFYCPGYTSLPSAHVHIPPNPPDPALHFPGPLHLLDRLPKIIFCSLTILTYTWRPF